MNGIRVLALLTVPMLVAGASLPAAPPAMPQPAGLIANIEHRTTTSLDGQWHFIVDPYDTGYFDYRHQPRSDGYFLRARPKTPRDLIEYDFDEVGHAGGAGRLEHPEDGALLLRGHGLVRAVASPTDPPRRDAVVFLALRRGQLPRARLGERRAALRARGRLHALRIARSPAGEGRRQLRRHRQGRQPAAARCRADRPSTDWWNYGGLTRSVEIVEVPASFLEDYFLQLRAGSADLIEGWVRMSGGSQPCHAADPGAARRADAPDRRPGAPSWRAGSPARSAGRPSGRGCYDVELEARRRDRRASAIGFRTIEVRGRDILAERQARSSCAASRLHEEAPYRPGPGRTRGGRAHAARLGRRSSTATSSRLAHYPHNREHGARGRPRWAAGLVRDPGLLDDRLGERRHPRERAQASSRR